MRLLVVLTAAMLAGASQAAEHVGSYHWTYPKPYFGGWSGLELSEDGLSLLAIGDSGQIAEGRIRREDGRIVDVEIPFVGRLLTHMGKPVGPDYEIDSEGLAVAPDGRIFVSFERWVRIRSYDSPASRALIVARHPDFEEMRGNRSLEALAIDLDGTLYAIPEGKPGWFRDRNVYRMINGVWEIFGQVPSRGFFKPVGADIGPDGELYLLERRYVPFLGFKSRIRRFSIGSSGLEDEETLLQTGFQTHDNLEGISVWRDGDGRLRVTMISDDNFSRFQRTEIVEYVVPARLEPGPQDR